MRKNLKTIRKKAPNKGFNSLEITKKELKNDKS
jgi:hypothetical protein